MPQYRVETTIMAQHTMTFWVDAANEDGVAEAVIDAVMVGIEPEREETVFKYETASFDLLEIESAYAA